MQLLRHQAAARATGAVHCGRAFHPTSNKRQARVHTARRARSVVLQSMPSDVFVLDLDGVLIDSVAEVSTSGYKAASSHWADVFSKATGAQQQAIFEGLRKVHPVLVRGYESMVQSRLLLEDLDSWKHILENWADLLPSTLHAWNEDAEDLTKVFEEHRGSLMRDNFGEWLNLVRPYDGVKEVLQYCEFPFYVITAKAPDKASLILNNNFNLNIDADSPRLMGGLIPPGSKKAEALRNISQRPICKEPGINLHFIDDRLDTLKSISSDPQLSQWRLYLAEWGYNTQEQRDAASRAAGLRLLPLKGFLELLRWGILMGVDDGCQDTEDEVSAYTAPGMGTRPVPDEA